MKETEIAKYFVDYLSDYDLYFEIPTFQTDIVAKDGKILMAFEVKNTFNFKVIEQAQRNTQYFHYSYVCVPRSKDMGMQLKICGMLGIGVLVLNIHGYKGYIDERQKPKLNRHANKLYDYVSAQLKPYTKQSLPGASGNNGTTITPFKLTIEAITSYLRRNNGALIKDVYENVDTHYHSLSACRSCLYQWIRKGVIKEFYVDKSRLFLSLPAKN